MQRNLSHITYKRRAFIKSKDRAAFRSRHLWPQSETDSFRIQRTDIVTKADIGGIASQ